MKKYRKIWLFAKKDTYSRPQKKYEDIAKKQYQWDSTVANSRKVFKGDTAFLRVNDQIEGLCEIDNIIMSNDHKVRLRCVNCNLCQLNERRSKLPLYKCQKCGFESDFATKQLIDIIRYEAKLTGFIKIEGISVNDIKRCGFTDASEKSQNSIMELDSYKIMRLLSRKLQIG